MLKRMKIVICDDCIEDLIKLEKLLYRCLEFCDGAAGIETEKYTNPLELCEKICREEFADIYILDMLMSGKTGIDIGRMLRSSGKKHVIIYVTSSDDFALDAYRVHAARYLIKPVREADFSEALEYAFSFMEVKRGPVYLVKTKDGAVSVPCSRIEYIENVSRMLEVHLTDRELLKSIFIRKSFDAEIGELLADRRFLQVHKSYVINLNYVSRLTQGSVMMESGRSIPVSRARSAGVKKEYLLFVSGEYR